MKKYYDEVAKRTAQAQANARSYARKRRFAQAEQLATAQPTPEVLELVEMYKEFALAFAEYERQLDNALYQYGIIRPTWQPSVAQEQSRSVAATRMRALRARRKVGVIEAEASAEERGVQAPPVDACTAKRVEIPIEQFTPGDEVDADGRIWRMG